MTRPKNSRYALGVDIGGSHIRSAVVDLTDGSHGTSPIATSVGSNTSAVEIRDSLTAIYHVVTVFSDRPHRKVSGRYGVRRSPVYQHGTSGQTRLVSDPILLEKRTGWELWHLPTHRCHSYDIHRYKIDSAVDVQTSGKCHVLNPVEGESAPEHTGSSIPRDAESWS